MDVPPTPVVASTVSKERERDKEKDREREREVELEAALYTNCLLLGLDPSILGPNGTPRTGLFRHSNPKLGEVLLHFLLCALRGPAQSAKDFAGVWPIFDSTQSRDFRKIVQCIINELESQGALPRSNSRVSLLATCCGHRFVELLWQLSAHALREVHKRTFTSDASCNPLPASLTDMVNQSSHASALLTVTKAKIALERRRFLENASSAVQRQAIWSSLAHDLTAEYRALCAEEAYLQQELEKFQESKDIKPDLDGNIYEHHGHDPSTDQKILSVARASHLWERLLTHTDQHEELASGPIEDLIAHREHRYRISGAALRAAVDHGSTALQDVERLHISGAVHDGLRDKQEMSIKHFESPVADECFPRADERAGKPVSVDVAEILRRWTHALQRIHKQAVRLARSNEGGGAHLFKKDPELGRNGHIEALQTTLVEHTNHLTNIRTLVNQLKDAMPGMESTISILREQVDKTPLSLNMQMEQKRVPQSPAKSQKLEKEGISDLTVHEETKVTPSQLGLIPPSPALKLPQLFSVSSFPSEKEVNSQKNKPSLIQTLDAASDLITSNATSPARSVRNEEAEDNRSSDATSLRNSDAASLRQAVRSAALSQTGTQAEVSRECIRGENTHFFVPLSSSSGLLRKGGNEQSSFNEWNTNASTLSGDYFQGIRDSQLQRVNGSISINTRDLSDSHLGVDNLAVQDVRPRGDAQHVADDTLPPLSPTLLSEFSSFDEAYDDLLAPISEGEAAVMDSSNKIMFI